MTEDFDDPTPPAYDVPIHSPLQRVQDRLDLRITHLGGRLGGRLETLEAGAAAQAVWCERVAGADGDNGKLSKVGDRIGKLERLLNRVIAGLAGSIVIAAIAIYQAGIKTGDESAKVRALESEVLDLQQLRTQMTLRILSIPPAGPANPTGGP